MNGLRIESKQQPHLLRTVNPRHLNRRRGFFAPEVKMHDGIIEQDDDGAADAALAALVAERKAAIAAVQMVCAGAVSKILRDSRPELPIRIS